MVQWTSPSVTQTSMPARCLPSCLSSVWRLEACQQLYQHQPACGKRTSAPVARSTADHRHQRLAAACRPACCPTPATATVAARFAPHCVRLWWQGARCRCGQWRPARWTYQMWSAGSQMQTSTAAALRHRHKWLLKLQQHLQLQSCALPGRLLILTGHLQPALLPGRARSALPVLGASQQPRTPVDCKALGGARSREALKRVTMLPAVTHGRPCRLPRTHRLSSRQDDSSASIRFSLTRHGSSSSTCTADTNTSHGLVMLAVDRRQLLPARCQ